MKAIAIRAFGGVESLEWIDLPTPEAGAGELLIRAVASGVNPVDWKIREGRLKGAFPHEFPLIPGWEVAGVVESTGDGVSDFVPGDRVWAYARKPVVQGGTYAEYVVLPQTSVARMPDSLMFHQAAAMPLAGLTAWQCLFDDHALEAGQTVLIHAAAGGVGHLAVQMAKSVGATVIGTAGPQNQSFVGDLGADLVIDYKAADFREVIKAEHPSGIDLVLDTIGGETQTQSLDVLRPGGHLVSISSGPKADALAPHQATGRFVFVSPNPQQLDQMGALTGEQRLSVHISGIYSLADAADAHRESESGHVRGKLVLVM